MLLWRKVTKEAEKEKNIVIHTQALYAQCNYIGERNNRIQLKWKSGALASDDKMFSSQMEIIDRLLV